MRSILSVVFFFVMFSPLAQSATYYVNKGGSNLNSCATAKSSAPAKSKLTIAAGLSCLAAADTLIIGAGTYREGINNLIPSGISDTARTTVRSATGAHVIINGNTPTEYVLEIINKSYITIDGLDLASTGVHSALVIGASTSSPVGEPGSHYIIVQNSIMRDSVVFTCIAFRGGDSGVNDHITIRNNTIHNCGTTWPTIDGFRGHGIYATFHDGIIDGNTIYNIGSAMGPGMGIHQYGGKGGCGGLNNIIRNNIVHDTTSQGILATCGTGAQVYNNIVYSTGSADASGGIRLGDACLNCSAYDNTLYSNAVCLTIGAGRGSVVNKNICWNNKRNVIVDEGYSTSLSNNLCSNKCAVSSDPMFINAAAGNFSLQSGSPAHGMGAADVSSTPPKR